MTKFDENKENSNSKNQQQIVNLYSYKPSNTNQCYIVWIYNERMQGFAS